MLYSATIREVSRLEPHVAANVPTFIALCAEAGAPVLITETVRTDARQLEVYNAGYSKARFPSFHSTRAGLAFDICKNVRGEEYNDAVFWQTVGRIGKMMGFTWGGDWTSIVDKPHFQWDGHGAVTGTQVRAGIKPPPMPLYVDPVVELMNSLSRKGLMKTPAYWSDIVKGVQPLNPQYLMMLLKNVDGRLP